MQVTHYYNYVVEHGKQKSYFPRKAYISTEDVETTRELLECGVSEATVEKVMNRGVLIPEQALLDAAKHGICSKEQFELKQQKLWSGGEIQ